jgi:hypothetical protein
MSVNHFKLAVNRFVPGLLRGSFRNRKSCEAWSIIISMTDDSYRQTEHAHKLDGFPYHLRLINESLATDLIARSPLCAPM